MTLNTAQLEHWLEAFRGRRVLVVGDVMLDRYIYGVVRRISPEAPVPVVAVTSELAMPGGASNVARNVQTLGGQGAVAGVIGNDSAGAELEAGLQTDGVATDAMIQKVGGQTTVKTRIIAERQQVVRVDWDNANPLMPDTEAALGAAIAQAVARADAVVIEDYGKGVVTPAVVAATLDAARARQIPVGYDPKDGHQLDVRGVTVATPNRKEAYAAVGRPEPVHERPPLEDQDLLAVGAQLLAQWGCAHLMITLGAQGILLLAPDMDPVHVPARAREVFDVSGAGDTVIAIATLAWAAGAPARIAAELANLAAGVVVAQLGTAPCTVAALREQPL